MLASSGANESVRGSDAGSELPVGSAARRVFLVAAVTCALSMWAAGLDYPFVMQAEQPQIALHLYHGHGFLSPQDPSAAAQPTSWAGPVYPTLMAAFFRALGVGPPAIWAILGLHCLLFGATVALLFLIANQSFGRPAGWGTVMAVLANPFLLRMPHEVWDTALATTIFFGLVWMAVRERSRPPGLAYMVLVGLGFAALLLTCVALAATVPILTLWPLRRLSVGGIVKRSAICAAVTCLVLTPWTVRNWHAFHKLFLVRDGYPLELWLGNHPGSSGWMDLRRHPNFDRGEKHALLAMGETRYFAFCRDRFVEENRGAWGEFGLRTLRRIGYAMIGDHSVKPHPEFRLAMEVVPLVLAGSGVCVLMLRRRRGPRVMPVFLLLGAASMLPYVFAQMASTYTSTLKFCLSFYVGVALASVWAMAQRRDAVNLRNRVSRSADCRKAEMV